MTAWSDELYQLSLAEFTAGRDALAARLKASGDKDAAAEVKRAHKPSAVAWAANQVVWRAAPQWERLRAAVQILREAYGKGASADGLRQATREQRDAQHACEQRAGELLAAQGHAVTPGVLQKVGHTLLALAYGVAEAVPGCLDHELQPPGFEALSGVALAPVVPLRSTPPPAPVIPPALDKRSSRREEDAQARRREKAEAKVAATRRELATAHARLLDLSKRHAAAEKEVAAAEAEHREAEAALAELSVKK